MYNFKKMILAVIILTFVLGSRLPCWAGGESTSYQYAFERPGVLDLSGNVFRARPAPKGYISVKPIPISPAHAKQILDSPELTREAPEIISSLGDSTRNDEKKRVFSQRKFVNRKGRLLIIKPKLAPSVSFKDWHIAESKEGDGDAETFYYMGTVGAAGFHRVEVQYGHDGPGSFFVSPKTGEMVYAHNSADTVVLSPDGKHMVVASDGLNSPFGLSVVSLSESTSSLELYCLSRSFSYDENMSPKFKGWHKDGTGFDLVLTGPHKENTPEQKPLIPICFNLKNDGWHMSPLNTSDLDNFVGLSCFQSPKSF